jgi:hypothetical protein
MEFILAQKTVSDQKRGQSQFQGTVQSTISSHKTWLTSVLSGSGPEFAGGAQQALPGTTSAAPLRPQPPPRSPAPTATSSVSSPSSDLSAAGGTRRERFRSRAEKASSSRSNLPLTEAGQRVVEEQVQQFRTMVSFNEVDSQREANRQQPWQPTATVRNTDSSAAAAAATALVESVRRRDVDGAQLDLDEAEQVIAPEPADPRSDWAEAP